MTPSLTNLIKQGKELSAKSTKRPWEYFCTEDGDLIEGNQHRKDGSFWRRCSIAAMTGGGNMVPTGSNAEFITFAANHWDTLTAMLEISISALEFYASLSDFKPTHPCDVDVRFQIESGGIAKQALERINSLANNKGDEK